VIVPPAGRAVVTVKPTVTGTAALPAMRSVVCTLNVTADTRPTMNPDDTAADAAASADVDTVTPTAPGVTAPKVKPLTVTTTAEAGMIAEPVVMTTEVAPVAPHVPVSPATLLLPANIAEGVTPGAKKAEG